MNNLNLPTIHRIVNSFFTSCTYVIETSLENDVWIVDCGDVEPLKKLLSGKRIKGILLTHAHFDHIYGLNEIVEFFPGTLVFTNEAGRDALLDDKINMSRYHESPFVFNYPEKIRIVNDGDKIELGEDFCANVIPTPGHHPSCLTYLLDNAIFTGDSFIPGTKVVTNLPKGDKERAKESLETILRLAKGRMVYPGHVTGND